MCRAASTFTCLMARICCVTEAKFVLLGEASLEKLGFIAMVKWLLKTIFQQEPPFASHCRRRLDGGTGSATMLWCSDCEDTRMHVMCAVCLHVSAERECEQRQEDDEQANTISLGSYKAEGNMDNAQVELSARKAVVAM